MDEFVEKVFEAIKNGNAPWHKPWKTGVLQEMPKNASTNNEYKGINTINLAMSGFNDPRWVTYNQAKEMGGQVKKGEKSTTGFFYCPARLEEKRGEDKNLSTDKKPAPAVFNVFSLFNGTQIKGMEAYIQRSPEWNPEQKAELLIKSIGVPIFERQLDRAFYRPSKHIIEIPHKSQFSEPAEYYSTVFHELAHATAHKSILGREIPDTKDGRIKEELKAEIAAWMVCTQTGIGYTPRAEENNQRYVASFLSSLPKETRSKELGAVIREAEKIANHIFDLDPELKKEWVKPVEKQKNKETATMNQMQKSMRTLVEKLKKADPENINISKMEQITKDAFLDEEILSFYEKMVQKSIDLTMKINSDLKKDQGVKSDENQKNNSEKFYLHIPFEQKDAAKKLGAKWDKKAKSWFIAGNENKKPFEKWLEAPKAPTVTSHPDMAEVATQFKLQAEKLGLVIDSPVMDGKFHRVPVNGDGKGKKSGAYVLYEDGRPAGYIQNHKTGEKGNFKYQGEITAIGTASSIKKPNRQEETEVGHETAAKTAFGIYNNAQKVKEHEYLTAKSLKTNGEEYRVDKTGNLIISAVNPKTHKIESLQFISPDGEKRFLTGGKKSGNCHVIGKIEEDKPVLLVEGYATGKTLHDISHLPAVVCFDANNLENVAKQIKELVPSAELFICADNDHTLKNNVGIEKAQKAAKAVGAVVIIPKFTAESKKLGYTDFNDLARCQMGGERVRNQLKAKIKHLSKDKDKSMGIDR